jgi:hypothetical protein
MFSTGCKLEILTYAQNSRNSMKSRSGAFVVKVTDGKKGSFRYFNKDSVRSTKTQKGRE